MNSPSIALRSDTRLYSVFASAVHRLIRSLRCDMAARTHAPAICRCPGPCPAPLRVQVHVQVQGGARGSTGHWQLYQKERERGCQYPIYMVIYHSQ
jgi:hypothetical protein